MTDYLQARVIYCSERLDAAHRNYARLALIQLVHGYLLDAMLDAGL